MSEATVNRSALARRGQKLEYLTIAWNAIEAGVAVWAGAKAGSISLLAFGGDSLIELASGAALLWRMSVDANSETRTRHEKRALCMVGVCFIALAAYVLYSAGSDLVLRRHPEHSLPGIVIACLALIVMPMLARAKRKIGRLLSSTAMTADAKQSEFCAYLSAILLGGLLLNSTLGFWWADAAAALVMVPLIIREGIEALRGERCESC